MNHHWWQRQPLKHGVRKGCSHQHHRPRSHQRRHHVPPNHLSLSPRQIHRQSPRSRRRRRRQNRPGNRQDLEPPVQGQHAPRRLTERHVRHRAVAAEHAHAPPAAPGVLGEALRHVGAGGDLQHVRAERVGAVARHYDRRLGLVLGPRRTATWAACGGGSTTSSAVVVVGGGMWCHKEVWDKPTQLALLAPLLLGTCLVIRHLKH